MGVIFSFQNTHDAGKQEVAYITSMEVSKITTNNSFKISQNSKKNNEDPVRITLTSDDMETVQLWKEK